MISLTHIAGSGGEMRMWLVLTTDGNAPLLLLLFRLQILLEIACANLAEALLLHTMGENQALAGPLCDLVILTAQHVET